MTRRSPATAPQSWSRRRAAIALPPAGARRVPGIAEDVYYIDNAVKWGFNYEAGPFESWDALGVEESVARMKKEGKSAGYISLHIIGPLRMIP